MVVGLTAHRAACRIWLASIPAAARCPVLPLFSNYTSPADIAETYSDVGEQVMFINNGVALHSLRLGPGNWTAPGEPSQPPYTPTRVSAANGGSGTAQFIAVAGGYIYHDIRYSNGAWQGWNNESLPFGWYGSASIHDASITGDNAGTTFVCATTGYIEFVRRTRMARGVAREDRTTNPGRSQTKSATS